MPTPPTGYARALIIEDLPDVQHSLAQIVAQAFPGIDIHAVGTLKDARTWLANLPPLSHGLNGGLIALVDLGLPDGNGITLIQELSTIEQDILPVVTTIFDDDVTLCNAIAAGAQGYLLKEHPPATLVRYLRRIQQGEPALTPRMARRILACMQQMPPRPADQTENNVQLSPRETEVLSIIGRGLRVNETAKVLGLSEQTVASYVKTIYRKLNISSRAEAALEASRRRLV